MQGFVGHCMWGSSGQCSSLLLQMSLQVTKPESGFHGVYGAASGRASAGACESRWQPT